MNQVSVTESNGSDNRMGLAEARTVRWLRHNHRPLGELLDEGYLNQQRLAWAAEKAYDARLRRAAAVVLDSLRRDATGQAPPEAPLAPEHKATTIEASVGVEQARETVWPFRPFKGQAMGPLVESRQVGLKDLAHAIESAWDERVRQAAVVLMAQRLKQVVQEPPPPAGPLRVVSGGRSYSERRQYKWTTVQGMMMGAAIMLVLWMGIQVIGSLQSWPAQSETAALLTPVRLIALGIVLALVAAGAWLFNRLLDSVSNQVERQIEAYRKGQEGEERVVEALRQDLDGQWTLFRNVVLPGRKADIDGVLVGPPGVWSLEMKNYAGRHRNVGEHWERRVGKGWKLLPKSPSRQAQRNATALANFLRASSVRQWVEPAIVWANQESALSVENPMVAVWPIDRLPEELGNLWGKRPMSEEQLDEITEKMAALCHASSAKS